jgi:cytochrome oxidase Cu insertion factor (SCO1/SenC/PrrC family)
MSDAAPRRNLVSLWLIVALTTAPVAASYVMYYFWPPATTANYGELIGPHVLPDAKLTLMDNTPLRLAQLKGKWVLAMIDTARCDAHCEKKLVYMRQLRLTQGKNSDRVERLWLVSGDGLPGEAADAARQDGTRVARADADLLRLFPAPAAATDHIYLIDPLGNLMMRFPRDPDPRLMIKDLSRLLKASQVG